MAEDGEALDSWEDQEDLGILDKRLDEIKVKTPPKTAVASAAGVREDSERTEYQPQMRILKRNPEVAKTNASNNSSAVAKPMKTLEQREAEYAEARMRIFGSLEDPATAGDGIENVDENGEDESESAVQKINATPSSNAVSRQPKGPDGSKGFNLAR